MIVDLTIKLDKAYKNLESYKKLPLKRARDGSIITLSDVARVELGAESIRTLFKGDGKQVVGIGIYQQSDANTIKVANGRLTCAEALGHKEFVMTKLYRSA